MTLQEEYKKETGADAYSYDNKSNKTYYNPSYVTWLENKINAMREKVELITKKYLSHQLSFR